ncbi:MAG: sugar phosphate isomerase/epimerase [Clostridiaceae bacterium]|nr:sugar phosphate isomerase/epimerase [Clostridiaceae bacterium]
MQLGIRLHDTEPGTLEERLVMAKEQGFTCVHLALSKTITEHSVKPAALTPGFAMHLKKIFTRHDMDIAVLGCYLNLANPDEKALKEIQEAYLAHVRFAAQLGCGVVGTETGAPNTSYTYEEACKSEEALHIFIKNLRPVVECAEKMGVLVAIEPVWCHIVYNSKRALQVLKEINSPNLRIILDPVNLLSSENYTDYEKVIEEAVEDLGDYVEVMHMKDFRFENGRVVSVAAGTGVMNYDKLLGFLKAKKPYIHATLEDTTPDNAAAAREFLEKQYIQAQIN